MNENNDQNAKKAQILLKGVLKKTHKKVICFGFKAMQIFRVEVNLQQHVNPKKQVSYWYFFQCF